MQQWLEFEVGLRQREGKWTPTAVVVYLRRKGYFCGSWAGREQGIVMREIEEGRVQLKLQVEGGWEVSILGRGSSLGTSPEAQRAQHTWGS